MHALHICMNAHNKLQTTFLMHASLWQARTLIRPTRSGFVVLACLITCAGRSAASTVSSRIKTKNRPCIARIAHARRAQWTHSHTECAVFLLFTRGTNGSAWPMPNRRFLRLLVHSIHSTMHILKRTHPTVTATRTDSKHSYNAITIVPSCSHQSKLSSRSAFKL